jgi:hypothetical protein
MENNPENKPKSGINLTAIIIVLVVCATLLASIYILAGGRREAGVPASSARAAAEKGSGEPAPPARPAAGIIEKGLAATGLQKAEGGKASEDYYNRFMAEQVLCQMTAGTIRSVVEKIDLSPVGTTIQIPSKNIPGVRKALEVAASYYRRSVRGKLSISSAGIDPAVVAYVEKLATFDEATNALYEEYARTLQPKSREIEEIGKARDSYVAQEEPALLAGFESKFGIKLPTRQHIREVAGKLATDEAKQFLDAKSAQELSANLLGQWFRNLNDFGSWHVEAGEYVFGRVMESASGPGVASVDLEVQLKGSRSGNPGLVRARIIYAKDPERNVFWTIATLDLAR